MIDWLVLLTPLVLLPIVLLFAFVGCATGVEDEGTRGRGCRPLVRIRGEPREAGR